ncbi:hypothetical protein GCM10022409_41750 [Hymenobacter glaciei]|uniref:DUF304 domain-containing protein n=1 Tax=Hymenobacter glaciei TaxID=877209 RepID=A0ABP7URA5_9BACT
MNQKSNANNKISIGTVQPIAVKRSSFIFVFIVCLTVAIGFVISNKTGYWIGLIIDATLFLYTYFRTINTVNVFICDKNFIIEHAFKRIVVKEFSLFKGIETSYFYYRIVFEDGTKYYFYPSLKGVWKSFIKDSQGYSNYVRGLMRIEGRESN